MEEQSEFGAEIGKKIEHAGYERYIISRNPKRYDEDGDELDDDEVDEQADIDAASRNPYHEIRLEGELYALKTRLSLLNLVGRRAPSTVNIRGQPAESPLYVRSIPLKYLKWDGAASMRDDASREKDFMECEAFTDKAARR